MKRAAPTATSAPLATRALHSLAAVALVAALLPAMGCGTAQWQAAQPQMQSQAQAQVPASCGQNPDRAGLTQCGMIGTCQAGQWCANSDFMTCEAGCTSDNNCTGTDYCDRLPGEAVGACTSCDQPPRAAMASTSASGGGTLCDPADCDDFCQWAVCLWGNQFEYSETCVAHCEANCGEPYFDEENAAVISCVLESDFDLACRSAQACCDEHFTNQICP